MAIALDRYKVIVYPTHKETASGACGYALLLASVWLFALLLSLPLFAYRTVESAELRKYNMLDARMHNLFIYFKRLFTFLKNFYLLPS